MFKIRSFALCAVTAALVLAGCSDDADNPPSSVSNPPSPTQIVPETPTPPPTPTEPEPGLPPLEVPLFAEGELTADIRRTNFGVPHITANSLEEIAFGTGYTQAEDHLCILADAFVKANSRRSEFFGPHASINIATGEIAAEDNGNLVSDFGYLATGIRAGAEANIGNLPERSRAILAGFATGYNKYIGELANNPTPNLPCAGQPWVMPIEDVDLLTYMYSIALLPGAANFLDLMFFANPGDGLEYLPRFVTGGRPSPAAAAALKEINDVAQANAKQLTTPEINPLDLGSNGWGLGGAITDNGQGILLANPHFPHTGQIRFHQTHLTIPGVMDVTGGSLIGMPGAVNIGFNENLAWTHTFSTAEHFVVYQLGLTPGNRENYVFDGQALPIEKRTFQIMVNIGTAVVPMEKDMFVTARGPMIEAPPQLAPFAWDDSQAFYVQDANAFNNDVIEHWVAMNLARNLNEFQQAFKDYDGVIFNNTMYADAEGNAWYIDDSTVPGLTGSAQAAIKNDPTISGLRAQAGFTILPGVSSLFGFTGPEPYEYAPKLQNRTYVQNSNDSFWLTNASTPIEFVSPLYGDTHNVQSLRSRMGHYLLNNARGEDSLFSAEEVEAALFSNGAYLANLVLEELLAQCQAHGDNGVIIGNGTAHLVAEPCAALGQWDGNQNVNSVAGALFREFAYSFCSNNTCAGNLAGEFDPNNPTMTPVGLPDDGSALIALAEAADNLRAAGFDLDATMGQMQFTEKSLPDGSPSGAVIPWPGANNREGGFNVFSFNHSLSGDGTLLPHHSYPRATNTVTGGNLASGLSSAGYHVRYGSSWMMVVQFTDNGPQGRGILTFSQSNNFLSEHWNDQSLYYAQNNSLRPILFTEDDVAANVLSSKTITNGD